MRKPVDFAAGEDRILSTSRLILRKLTRDDLDFVAELRGDAEVMRYYPKVLTREESLEVIERQLQRYADDGHGVWLASEKESNAPRGLVGVAKQFVEGETLIEVGYMIHRAFWKQGLASEAARACYHWAFEHLETDVVCSLIRPENVPSQGVARKLGLVPRSQLVMHYGFPHHVFEVSREQWRDSGLEADHSAS